MKQAKTALILSIFIWGSTYGVNKLALNEIPPVTLAMIRFAIASLVLSCWVLFLKKWPELRRALKEDWFYFLMVGIFGIALMYISENFALKMTSTSETAIITNSDPLLVAILSSIFLKEKFDAQRFIGLMLGFFGMTVVISRGFDIASILQSQSFFGNILAFVSSCAWGVYIIMSKKRIMKYGPVIFTTATSIFGALAIAVMALFFEKSPDLLAVSTKTWLLVLYLGIVVSAFNFTLWNYALLRLKASNAAMYWYLVPVVAVFGGVIFLKENLTLTTIMGGILILTGIYLMERKTGVMPEA
jgi:drug/metabolite transporter (DMT)-like permease